MGAYAARPWLKRNFAILSIGQGISGIGDAVCTIALMLAVVTTVARGQTWAPLAVSGVLAVEVVPLVVLRPIAGVWVDRWAARAGRMRYACSRSRCWWWGCMSWRTPRPFGAISCW